MTAPPTTPRSGLVIRYEFLFSHGVAELHPCLIFDVDPPVPPGEQGGFGSTVRVVPITHSRPRGEDRDFCLPIPPQVCSSLRLDARPHWLKAKEANSFTWLGPDVRAVSVLLNPPSRFAYGTMPREFLKTALIFVLQTRHDLTRQGDTPYIAKRNE